MNSGLLLRYDSISYNYSLLNPATGFLGLEQQSICGNHPMSSQVPISTPNLPAALGLLVLVDVEVEEVDVVELVVDTDTFGAVLLPATMLVIGMYAILVVTCGVVVPLSQNAANTGHARPRPSCRTSKSRLPCHW